MEEVIQSITQATCTNCSNNEAVHDIESRITSERGVYFHTVCNCGAEGIIRIAQDGLHSGGPISHESASWNTTES